MGHIDGTVTFKDGLVLHFEYNGVSNVCIPNLYHTIDELDKHWRMDRWTVCTCNRDEEVIIYSKYDDGFDWYGRACRYCMAMTEGLDPDYSDCDYSYHGYKFY